MSDNSKLYIVKANGFTFSFTKEQIDAADIVQTAPAAFNLLFHHRSVQAKLATTDASGKKFRVETEGETIEVEIKDELDQQLEKMGYGSAAGKQVKEIKAPMPGLVLEIAVTNGQDVNEGDRLLILEAMKMENSIMIHTNARIKNIAVSAGQAVEKGQVLVELE